MCPIFLLEKYKATRKAMYLVLARMHSETLEEMVIYKALYGEGKTWVCPKEMFFEDVTLADGSVVKRFAPVKSCAECANIISKS